MESKRRKMDFNPPDDLGQNLVESHVPVKQLPCELLLLITKYLGNDDCVSLALSGAIKGFSAFYRLNWKHVISNRCFYLTPSIWPVYFKKHIIPASVTSFNVNHLYWLPAELIADGILQMKNLEELGVRDTQVTLPILADILNGSSELVKLDFGFRFEKDWKNLKEDLKKVLLDSMAVRFKKLTCLKVSTCVHDARDYRHDPWQPILSFLSFCRDCVELNLEITYTGSGFEYRRNFMDPWVDPALQFTDVSQFIRETVYTHLGWMKSLRSLVITKLGPFVTTSGEGRTHVESLMLNDLLAWVFSEERAPRSLQHLWIKDFCLANRSLEFCAPSLKTCLVEYHCNEENYTGFPNLEVVATIDFKDCPLLHLPNLKYIYGWCSYSEDYDAESEVNNFVRTHPKLEYLTIEYCEADVTLNHLWKLPNLKVLNYLRETIDKEIVDSLVKVYPNVEILYLYNRDSNTISEDSECLSSIKFTNLTSLSLRNFKVHDGAFLLPMIKQCSKLQRLNMCKIPSVEPAFVSNLDLFLPLAEKLRDVRLEFTKFDGSLLLPLLKTFFKNSSQLERLALLDGDCDASTSEWNHLEDRSELADFIVNFASEMPHLVALCIHFFDLDSHHEMLKKVKRRIVKEVLPSKPSFWFYFGWKDRPLPSKSSVPLIHYQQMISPELPFSPPKIELLP